jgi:hypothetical protein
MIDVKEEWLAKSAKLGDSWSSWMVMDVEGPFFFVIFFTFGFFCLFVR